LPELSDGTLATMMPRCFAAAMSIPSSPELGIWMMIGLARRYHEIADCLAQQQLGQPVGLGSLPELSDGTLATMMPRCFAAAMSIPSSPVPACWISAG
jgi:hypothetical protein